MKRVVIGLMVLVLTLCLAVGAFAKTGTVPKQLCIQNTSIPSNKLPAGSSNALCLVPKMSGTISMSSGPMKFYNITGEVIGTTYSFPVGGSGHVFNNKFHFTLTAIVFTGGSWDQYWAEGFYTLGAASATVSFYYMDTSDAAIDVKFDVVDCNTLAVVYNAEETSGRE